MLVVYGECDEIEKDATRPRYEPLVNGSSNPNYRSSAAGWHPFELYYNFPNLPPLIPLIVKIAMADNAIASMLGSGILAGPTRTRLPAPYPNTTHTGPNLFLFPSIHPLDMPRHRILLRRQVPLDRG